MTTSVCREDCREDSPGRDTCQIWFKHHFTYSVESKIPWCLTQLNIVTNSDITSVQNHFNYILIFGHCGMDVLLDTYCQCRKDTDSRCQSKESIDIIDSFDVEEDFDVLLQVTEP